MAQVFIFVTVYLVILLHFDFLQCHKPLEKPNISPECESKGICDNVKNYPTKLMKELIEKLPSQNRIYNYNEAPKPFIISAYISIQKKGLCETIPRDIPVQAAKDMLGKWQYIINDSKKPVQVFRTEICSKENSSCSKSIGFGPGYIGGCVQKMVFREMFYVNETKGVSKTYFAVPVCCSCSLFRTHNAK